MAIYLAKFMQDPFNPGTAIGKIVLTGPAPNRAKVAAGDYLPVKNVDGYMIRAAQRRVVGRNQDAISDYDKALEIAPTNGDILFCKGQTYVAMGKKEDAIASFKAAGILFEKAGIDRQALVQWWIEKQKVTVDGNDCRP